MGGEGRSRREEEEKGTRFFFLFYHKEVIKQEDLPLMQAQLLGLAGIWHFKQPAVTHQATMRQRQHLKEKKEAKTF